MVPSMLTLRVSLAAALLAAASTSAFAQSAPIIGGTKTTVGAYPSVVSLTIGGGLCTGTLITPEWVLTAAHCVDPAVVRLANQAAVTASTKVHFNTVDVLHNPGTVVSAAETIPNPAFNVNALGASDIGLIRLATPVTTVTPSPVNFDAAKAPVGVMVTMVGFGTTQVNAGGGAGVEYELKARTSTSCSALGGGSDANLLCFSQTDSKGKCEGDSGGPSFATLDGKLVVVGITSFGDQSCAQFGADTRVDAEKAFLLQHIPGLKCIADGVCEQTCGAGNLPIDPDCPVCAKDSDCGTGEICFKQQCIPGPTDPEGLGSDCTTNADCASGSCATGPDGQRCVLTCTAGIAESCPAGFDCLAAGATGACWLNSESSGCCDASGAGAPTMLFGFGVVALVLGKRRRRVA